MIIYGEYLFLENCVTGWLMILLTAKLTGCRPARWRQLAGSLLGGACSFIMFAGISGCLSVSARAAVCLMITAVTFGRKDIMRRTLLLLALTFLSGGAAMAFLLWQQTPALSAGGALYVQPLTYGKLILWGTAAFGTAFLFVRIVKGMRMDKITKGEVCLTINDEVYKFEALVDSGNSLREPLTRRPVMLIDKKGSSRLPADVTSEDSRWFAERAAAVPYRAVGTDRGFLRGFRTGDLTFEGKNIGNVIVAFYDGDFGEFEMLLNREVLNDIT